MKGKFLMPLTAIAVLVLGAGLVSAQSANGQSNGVGTSTQTSTTNQGEDSQITSETQSRTQTNNPDVGTMTQEEIQTRTQESITESAQTYTAQNAGAQERSNKVNQAVKNMITMSYQIEDQNLGEQIRNVAQEMNLNQDQANMAVDQADTRTSFAKFFIGPNYTQLTQVKQVIAQNQLMIQQLNRIRAQISNAGENTELANQIKVLESENTALQEELNQLESGFSLFGWLVRWIKGYTN